MKKRVFHRPKLRFVKQNTEAKEIKVVKEGGAKDDPVAVAVIPVFDKKPSKTFLRPQQAPVPSAKTQALRSLAKSLKAQEVALENPCIKRKGPSCERTAMDSFYSSLDAVAQQESGAHATVVTLGNSLIASDHVTDKVRERLVSEFGDGGRGFLLPDRLSKQGGRRVRTGRGTPGWTIHTFAQKRPKRKAFGVAGSMHESTVDGDRIRWKVRGARSARLHWLDHKDAPAFTLSVDGKPLTTVTPSNPQAEEDRIFDFEIPPKTKELVLRAPKKGVVLYGIALSNDVPGVMFDTIGVPASDARLYNSVDEARFSRQLASREPSMVVVMVGGNETRSLSFKKASEADVKREYAAMIDRVRAAAPDASCLAVSPIDAAKATAAGAELTTRPELLKVVALEKEIALAKGCAFFNLFESMGGPGSLQRFHRKSLVNADLVHPLGKGGDVLGTLIADALLTNYRTTPIPKEKKKIKRRLVRPLMAGLSSSSSKVSARPENQLQRLYDSLSQLEGPRRQKRTAVGVFGDGIVEDDIFVSQLRKRLQDRFGSRGRGLVTLGEGSAALSDDRVTLKLKKPYELVNGRRLSVGGAVSASGKKTRLFSGAQAGITFCEGCKARSASDFRREGEPAFLDVSWLYTPGMSTADVYVNDVLAGTLSEGERRAQSDVQFFRVPVRGESHTVSIKVAERSKKTHVDVLSVAAEVESQGVVLDAVGLRGATAMTMQRWRNDIIAEQVTRRRYDLVAFVYGAEESALSRLDALTYKHHASKTMRTILDASPGADCVVLLPFDRQVSQKRAPKLDMVRRVQRELANENLCALFSMSDAMGGERGLEAWKNESLVAEDKGSFTREGYQRLADLFANDLMTLYDYTQERAEVQNVASAQGEK